MSSLGIHVSELNLDEIPNVDLPAPAPDGRIATTSNMGFMTQTNSETSQAFIDFAAECKLPVLDGGAAYGVASIAALKKGATVISNDVDMKMLYALAKNKELTADDRNRLYLKCGYLPDDLEFEANSLGAIHLSRCMHHFKPDMIERMFERAHEWLAPGGRLYIITMSFFHYAGEKYLQGILERKKAGVEWPGEINDFSFVYGNTKKYHHSLEPAIIMKLADKYGFIAKSVRLTGGKNDNDYVAAIFIKP